MKKINLFQVYLFALSACCFTACGTAADKTGDGREEIREEVFNLPDADITIPKSLVGTEVADIATEYAEEESIASDMVTYHLTGSQRTAILNDLAADIEESIVQILSDKDYYPNITDIQSNDDYTEFVISLSSNTPNLYESTLLMSFITIGDKYQIYSGIPAEAALTAVIYQNSETGAELARSDSASIQ